MPAYSRAEENVGRLLDAGVTLLAGTDAPNPGTVFGASLHHELELLVRCGMTPTQALTAATAAPASVFHLADRGRIAPGQRGLRTGVRRPVDRHHRNPSHQADLAGRRPM
jgi:imidazolonepropionase-like amidohydrolase